MFSGITPLTAETIVLSCKGMLRFLNSFMINAEGMATIIISACLTTVFISVLILRRLVLSVVDVK